MYYVHSQEPDCCIWEGWIENFTLLLQTSTTKQAFFFSFSESSNIYVKQRKKVLHLYIHYSTDKISILIMGCSALEKKAIDIKKFFPLSKNVFRNVGKGCLSMLEVTIQWGIGSVFGGDKKTTVQVPINIPESTKRMWLQTNRILTSLTFPYYLDILFLSSKIIFEKSKIF